jgi:hypothetical protein
MCEMCDLFLLVRHLTDRQVELRLSLDRIQVLASQIRAAKPLSPMLGVALWNLKLFGRWLERHLNAANSRLLLVAPALHPAIA